MRAFLSSTVAHVVLGLLATSGGRATGQEPHVSWNPELNDAGASVVRTDRELLPRERLEIEVVESAQALEVGIGRTDGSPFARIWQPGETKKGATLSFTMSKQTQVGLGVSQGDCPFQRAKVKNANDQTILSYDSGVVLQVKAIRPGMNPDRSTNGPQPSADDDKPGPPRREVVEGKDGKFSIRTKALVDLAGTITVEPLEVSFILGQVRVAGGLRTSSARTRLTSG